MGGFTNILEFQGDFSANTGSSILVSPQVYEKFEGKNSSDLAETLVKCFSDIAIYFLQFSAKNILF